MSKDKHNDVINELRSLPKPELQVQVQNQMWHDIQKFSSKHQKRKRWENYMKKFYVSSVTVVVVLIISFLSYNIFSEDDADKGIGNTASQIEETNTTDENVSVENKNNTVQLDPVDQKSGEHQVAIRDLYFEIPMTKDKVFIDRRVEKEFTLVDIRDKATNKLLYRYGESIGESTEKRVFREVQTDYGTVRMHVQLKINRDNAMIESVKNTSVEVVKNTLPFEEIFKYGYSRSDKYPAEKIEVIVKGGFRTETILEDFYEGYSLSVVPK